MLNDVKLSLLMMSLVFLGTALGGLTAKYVSTVIRGNYRYLQLLCGGILAGLLGLDIIPESIYTYNPIGLIIGMSAGIILMLFLDSTLHHINYHRNEKLGIYFLLFIALSIHCIPTGIALGMSFQQAPTQNDSLLLAIILHHLPEGMVLMIAVLISKASTKIFWLLCLCLSLVIMTSCFIGISIQSVSLKTYSLFLGTAIGTLSYVTFYEILWKELKNQFTIKLLAFALLGFLLFYLVEIFALNH